MRMNRVQIGRWMVALLLVVSTAFVSAQPEQEFPLPQIVEILEDQRESGFTVTLLGGDGGIEWGIDEYTTAPRCLAHPLLVAEQGFFHSGTDFFRSGTDFFHSGTDFFRSGTVGGVVLGDNTYVTPRSLSDVLTDTVPIYLQWPSSSNKALGDLMALDPVEEGDVVLVVLDDFGAPPGTFALPAEAFTLSLGGGDDYQQVVDQGWFTHGAQVMHVLNGFISATDLYTADPLSTPARTIWNSNNVANARLIVAGYNLADQASDKSIDTSEIADALREAVGQEAELATVAEANLKGLVVNMSWVLLPCPTVESFNANRNLFPTFKDYVDELKNLDGNGWMLDEGIAPEDIVRMLTWVGPGDPLYQVTVLATVDDYPELVNKRLAFVAASGNSRLPYQMLPAGWPAVIGVGAPVDGHPMPPFSNAAGVIATGAWFAVQPWEKEAAGTNTGVMALAGTSYSAPIVSLFTAIDIANKSRCTPEIFSGDLPGLKRSPRELTGLWLADAVAGCAY